MPENVTEITVCRVREGWSSKVQPHEGILCRCQGKETKLEGMYDLARVIITTLSVSRKLDHRVSIRTLPSPGVDITLDLAARQNPRLVWPFSVEEMKSLCSAIINLIELRRSGGSAAHLDKGIEELNLSVRAFNRLRHEGITTLRALVQKSASELCDIRNFGAKSLNEVEEKLFELGLSLREQTITL